MANVLEKICANKREELVQRKLDLPLSSFKDGLTPSDRSFYQALSQPNAGYVLECKKASPSKGLIRDDFNLDEIIAAYGPYAACISVLTDEKYFQGKFEYLEYVRARVSQPVLNKDFFVDPYQIYLARHHNADAVLLMLSVLKDQEYAELAALADDYQLDVLTEVSNEEEVHRALALGAKIIGINNRDLRDLSTNLATTEKLVPLIKQSDHECVVISESGIYSNKDVRRLAPLVDGFLVGSSVMEEVDVTRAVKKLIYGDVKICGITKVEDARFIASSGATYGGLIFAEKSPRAISLEQAKKIVAGASFHYVGVFVDETVDKIVEYAHQLDLAAVQLHGHEEQSFIDNLRAQLTPNCEIWKAFGVTDELPVMDLVSVDRFLLDCKVGEQSGGTGQQFDWHLLSQLPDNNNVMLAGGLKPENIQQARTTKVLGLDANSGVETAPGIKDQQKISQLFDLLRRY
ncbi:bifunctional indole-3-glycerol-phosphate synthase TrpC/phosphoribosylanthranilate isomerase TrpF [Aliiglaciecola sp. 3_MG-2023]|uniref:bifunctional indole-3-glycerol-phosphate synthase TrpC/phosphoribosylanthranilate isomerase TrpF n=1 Tax=Aliiglaciecola sp. 3_MG-2023 TaxID=3062644 RepID=UPI0026E2A11D|nr:bifunctional indole-3-glycerol-phosphate synthase TrpC/phosphoribosylanthranilate isomerase TrpF [Aliiglaciecola sp. 3_MG-2023]MDO6693512.1 bifunctional indole-3-glycerol-phosphate synthase TrpC/phosphoribosylanthranilate isomerase TrpF [Aliiglaciecola sp. 3_MG-2023]